MTALETMRDVGLLDAIGHAVIATDPSGTIQIWNTAAEQLYGWCGYEAIGRNVVELLATETDAGLGRVARIAAGETITEEYEVLHRDGHRFPVRVTAQPWVDEVGRVVGVVGVSIDQTERHGIARSLAEATELAGVGVWEVDLRTNIIRIDEQVANVLGLVDRTEITVEEANDLVHPADVEDMLARQAELGSHGVPQLGLRIVARDGAVRHVLINGGVRETRDGKPSVVGGVIMDVTEAHRAAAEIFETLENLSEGYVTMDGDLRFTFVNHHAEFILGMSRDGIVGRTVAEVFTEAHEPFTARYRAVLATGEPDEFEAFYPPHDAWYRIRVLRSEHGLTLSFRDSTDERRALTHDGLTGLPNRSGLVAWLDRALVEPDPEAIVCLLDLDRFRYLNDGIGHSFGDELLVAMARRLEGHIAGRDGIVARIGGDEFVLAVRKSTAEAGREFVHSILPAVREPIDFGGRRLIVTSSMGLAHTGEPGPWTAESLLRNADAALYRAKEAGGDRFATADASMRERALVRLELESDLRDAIPDGQLHLVYQPSFDLATGRPTGAEALVRWHHPERGVISPADFIPIAEETGLIIPLGAKVLDIVAAGLDEIAADAPPFTVWVNASIQQLRDPQFFQRIVDDTSLHGGRLGIELTETMFLEDAAPAADGLAQLSALGVKIAIDDFGTGYSSLARLPRYPFDLLKIDQSFIQNVDRAEFRAIVAASIQLGHGLQKRVIAEGVETREQLVALRRLGCDEVSGYLLARPVPAEELRDAAHRGIAELTGGSNRSAQPIVSSGPRAPSVLAKVDGTG